MEAAEGMKETSMFCTKCGAQLTSNAKFCAACGNQVSAMPPAQNQQNPQGAPFYPQQSQAQSPLQQQININIPQPPVPVKSKWETPRLIIGIITIVLFFLMLLQSCTAIAEETVIGFFSEEAGTSGLVVFFISFFFLAAGIISIACRKSKGGAITAGCIYAFCGLVLIYEDSTYFRDLEIYCFLSFVFAGILIIGGALQKK